MGKKKLLVVAHAPSENTQRLFAAVGKGAKSDTQLSVTVDMLSPFNTKPEDVLACDAIILGTTENLGYMSGALKDFFDRCYYPVLERKQGLPYGLFIRAVHDGTGTRRAVESITKGLRWRPVQQPLICHGDWDDTFVEKCHDLGVAVAVGLDMGVF